MDPRALLSSAVLFPFLRHAGDALVIVGENDVNAHVKELLCFLFVVSPEHVAADTVRGRLVNHLLIEIRLA